MVSDPEIRRTADFLILKHGADAELEAAKRADMAFDRGDIHGQLIWARVRRTIKETTWNTRQ